MTNFTHRHRIRPASLLGRLVLSSSLVLGLAGWLVIEQVERHEDQLAETATIEATQNQVQQLRAEAAALAAAIDGDRHEALVRGFGSTRFEKWSEAPQDLQNFREEIRVLGAHLGTEAEVTTFRVKTDERQAVEANANELRPNALQEFFTTGETSTGWTADTSYHPDMELPLIPHHATSTVLETEEGRVITALAPIESQNGDLAALIRLDKPAPKVASLASDRRQTLIPLMAGGGLIMLITLIGSSASLRKDLRTLRDRISLLGKSDEDADLMPATLSDFSEVLKQADQADQSVSKKLAREEATRVQLESRLRDAELGLCPRRRAHRERFAKASPSIQTTISVDSTRSVRGTLVDLTLEEAILGLPSGGAVDLAPGFPARIRITSPGDDQIAEIIVETLNQATVGKMSLVRLRITNPTNLRSLPRELRHLVDNRRTIRVQPDPRNPVTARLAFNRGREERNARLIDLSSEGAGLQMREDLWKMAGWGATVELRLVLPDTEQSIKLPARIINAHRSGGRVRVGIQFDMKRVTNSPHYRKIQEYLSARQAELRQELGGKKEKNSSLRRLA